MNYYKISFPGTAFPGIHLPKGPYLAEYLTAKNSPILFGCRAGICGTCLMEVIPLNGKLLPPNKLEVETLLLMAPHHDNARLACQLNLTSDIAVKKINSL